MAVTAPACASCIFGAASTSILSFSYHAIETITVSVIPHVTVYTDGSRSTSFESITQTQTDLVGTGPGSNSSKTYTNLEDITWTVGDATLTYPTTYVQYLGFEGAPLTTDDGQTCAQQTDVSAVELPASTDAASFIYPLAVNATAALQLPTALLEYLGELAPIASQFNGDVLTGCAPLNDAAIAARHAPHEKQKRFDGVRRTTIPQPQITSRALLATNGTLSYNSTGMIHTSFWRNNTITHYPGPDTFSYKPPKYPSPTGTTEFQSSVYTSAQETLSAGPPGSYASINTHATAFVIQPIAGRPIVTTESGTQPEHHSMSEIPQLFSVSRSTSNKRLLTTSTEPTPSPGPPGGGHAKGGGHGDQHSTKHHSQGQQHNPPPPKGPSEQTSKPTPKHGDQPPGGHNQPGAQSPGGNQPGNQNPGHDKPGDQSPGHNQPGNGESHTDSPSPRISDHQVHPESGPPQPKGGSNGGDGRPAHQAAGAGNKPPVYSAGNTIVTAKSNGAVVYGSQTVKPGHSITVGSGPSKTIVGLNTNGGATHLVVNGKTYDAVPGLIAATLAPGTQGLYSTAVITTNGHTFTAIQSGGSVVLEDKSSTRTVPAGSVITFEGQTIKADPTGGAIIVNGHSSALSAAGVSAAVVTAGGHTLTAVDSGNSVILADGSSTVTLKDEAQTVFEGQTVSIGPGGSAVIVNGKTATMSAVAAMTTEAVITAGGHTFTAIDKSGYVILEDDTSTASVKDGHIVTFEGQTITAGPSGTAVVVNGKTVHLKATGTATSTGVSGYISRGLSGGAGASPSNAAVTAGTATNAASSSRIPVVGMFGALIALIVGFLAMP